jgi:TonB family protein
MLVYPRLLREAEIEGEVMVEAIIDTLGRAEPTSLRVVQTANPGFNEVAEDNVLDTRFRPGRVHGKAVRVLVRLPIRFRLRSH